MKPRLLSTARLSFPLAASIAALLVGQSAHAAAITWTGANTGTWNTAGNWAGGIPTISDDVTILGPSNLAGALTINFNVANSAKSLIFTNTAATNITNTTSGGNKILTIGSGGITTSAGAVQIGSITANQAVNITLGAAQTWNVGAGGLTVTNAIDGASTGITKTGSGTLTLNSAVANTFTGGITVNGGTLLVDFANRGVSNTNQVAATNSLNLGGGTIQVKTNGVQNATQTFAGVTVNAGAGVITNNPNGTTLNLNLGAITSNIAGGTLQYTAGTGTANTRTTSGNDSTGILSARILIGSTSPNWAINSTNTTSGTGGLVTAYAGYATAWSTTASAAVAGGTNTSNSLIDNSGTAAIDTTLSGAVTTNTLKIANVATAGTQSLVLGSNLLTLTSGGLLSTGTSAYTISGTAGGTTLTVGNGISNSNGAYDLIVHQFNTAGLTIGAVIGNNGGNAVNLVKSGSQTLTLTGANTYTGTTFLNAGTLSLGATDALSTTTGITMANGTKLQSTISGVVVNAPIGITTAATFLNNPAGSGTATRNLTLNGAITGTGNVTFSADQGSNGYALTILNAASSYVGNTTITTGTGNQMSFVRLGINNALPIATELTLSGTSTTAGRFTQLDLRGFNQEIAGLTGTNTANRTLQVINSLSATPTGTLTINTPVSTSFTFSGKVGVSGTPGTLIGANFSLEKKGAGTQVLSGANAFTGGTTISGGILQASNNSALGTGDVNFSGSAVRLVVDTGRTIANNITIGTNTGATGRGLIEAGTTAGTAIVSGDITINSGAANGGHFAAPTADTILDLQGVITSSATVTQRAGTVMHTGGGTGYTALTVGADTAKVGALNGIATTATVTMGSSGATNLDLNGFNQSLVGIVKSTNGATIGNSSTTADSVLTTTGTSSFAGVIQDTLGSGTRKVALTVNGGTLTLSGINSYTGKTTIAAGTLNAISASALGTSTVDMTGASTTLSFGTGTGSVTTFANPINVTNTATGTSLIYADTAKVLLNAPITLAANTTIQGAGTANQIGTTTLGTITSANNSNLEIFVNNNQTHVFDGTISLGAGSITRTAGSNANLTLSNASNSFSGGLNIGSVGLGDGTASNGATTITALGAQGSGDITFITGNTAPITFTNVSGTVANNIVSTGGTGGLIKAGASTMTLTGTNNYTGVTRINNSGGTLRITQTGALGAGDVSILTQSTSTGTLELALTGTNSFTNNVTTSSASALTTVGANAHILNTSGNNTISGNITTTASGGSGTNIVSDGGLLTLSGTTTHTQTTSRTLSLGGIGNGLVSGAIINNSTGNVALALNKSGAGTWTLSNASNTYTGATTISAGTLKFGNSNVIPNASAVTVGGPATSGTLDIAGFSDTIGTSVVTTMLTLGTNSTTVGGLQNQVINSGGSAVLAVDGGIAYNAGAEGFNNGKGLISANLQMGVTSGVDRNFTVNDSTATAVDLEITGILSSGTNGVGKSGAGTLFLNNDANTFTGQFLINAGTVQVTKLADAGGTSSLGTGSDNNLIRLSDASNATLEYVGENNSSTNRRFLLGTNGGASTNSTILNNGDGKLTFSDSSFFNNTTTSVIARTLTLGGSNTLDNTISGEIRDNTGVGGTVGVTKQDAGTWILDGDNSYTGATTINAGILAINGNQAGATGAVSVNNALTRLIGTGTVGGDTTINSGAIQSAGGAIADIDKVGKQTFDAIGAPTTNLTYGSGSIFEWDLNANRDTDGYDHDSNNGTANTNVGNRGEHFDAVDVSGTLTVASDAVTGAIFRVVLGSSVVSDAFWQQTQTWTDIFGGGVTLAGGFNNSLLQVVDTAGATYDQNTLNAGYGFTITGSTLTWTAVPEPTSALAGLLIAAGLLRRRRA